MYTVSTQTKFSVHFVTLPTAWNPLSQIIFRRNIQRYTPAVAAKANLASGLSWIVILLKHIQIGHQRITNKAHQLLNSQHNSSVMSVWSRLTICMNLIDT